MSDPTPRVIAPSAAAIQWQRAEARREENWHRKQRNDIRRQLLDRDPSYFGRKRRARRARGKWNMVAQPYLAAFMNPRLGEPWPEEQAQQEGPDEADQDSR